MEEKQDELAEVGVIGEETKPTVVEEGGSILPEDESCDLLVSIGVLLLLISLIFDALIGEESKRVGFTEPSLESGTVSLVIASMFCCVESETLDGKRL